jgi:hypothetical protein
MPPRVHDEKCDVTIPEVVIMLSWNACVVITTTVVNAICIVGVHKRWRVVGLADVVVDDLQAE